MTARMLDGRGLAEDLRVDLRGRVDRLRAERNGATPILGIHRDPASTAAPLYAASLERAARSVGIEPAVASIGELTEEPEALLERWNRDPAVAGVVIAQPFADAARGRALVEVIDPAKDVDGATPTNAGRLARGEPAFVPATALAVIAILEGYRIPVAGRRAVVVGRSAVVGRPVFSLLLVRDATVVVCHRATADLAAETRRAELLVVAAGVPGLIGPDMVHPSAVVVDCGITSVDGRIVGDVDPAAAEVVTAMTPVPGGIGPVTPMMVLRQTVEAAERLGDG
jgi:methylenetetrahydrofolate dehydrogenase (NADP+)/methenyltetrahydrofolate cyclohydrolase